MQSHLYCCIMNSKFALIILKTNPIWLDTYTYIPQFFSAVSGSLSSQGVYFVQPTQVVYGSSLMQGTSNLSGQHSQNNISSEQHIIEKGVGKNHRCVVCQQNHSQFLRDHPGTDSKNNPFRRSKTSYRCSQCKVYLCAQEDRSCWLLWHQNPLGST